MGAAIAAAVSSTKGVMKSDKLLNLVSEGLLDYQEGIDPRPGGVVRKKSAIGSTGNSSLVLVGKGERR